MKVRRTAAAVFSAVGSILLIAATSAHAVDSCKAKVDKNGVIRIDAKGVNGTLMWGEEAGAEDNAFFNAGNCIDGEQAKKCELADPSTLASKTAPPGCTVYLDDAGDPCATWIRHCSPAVREESAGGKIVVVDDNGQLVGPSPTAFFNFVHFTAEDDGQVLYVNIQSDGSNFVDAGVQGYTDAADCSGPLLGGPETTTYRFAGYYNGQIYYGPRGTFPSTNKLGLLYKYISYIDQAACDTAFGPGQTTYVAPDGCCSTSFPNVNSFGPFEVDTVGPFVPPFRTVIQ